MPSARRSKPFRKGCLISAAATAVLIAVFYLLLASGALEGLIRAIVHRATSGQDSVVSIYGGASNLLSSTTVDSVIVTNDRGLKVAVHGAVVSGPVHSFLFSKSVNSVAVDSLIITIPGPSDEPPDSSLSPIFIGTMAGMVARIDMVELSYGRIQDQYGTVLVDSLELNASISDIDSITVEVISAASFIPLFGGVTASGILNVDSLKTTFTDFSVISPPGTLDLSGTLNADSTFDFVLSGTASSTFLPDLPFGTASFSGILTGSIADPHALISLTEGCLNYDGLLIGFTADTISAGLSECTISGFAARTGGVSSTISGSLKYADLSWDGSLFLSFQNTDVGSYFPELPRTDISGTLSVSGYGVSDILQHISVTSNFAGIRIDNYTISDLSFSCSGNTSQVDGQVTATMGGGSLESDFSLSLGNRLVPVAWSGSLIMNIPDFTILSAFVDSTFGGIRGLTASLSGEGNRSAFSVQGRAGVGSFSGDMATIERASFSGNVTSGASGIAASGTLGIGLFLSEDIRLSQMNYSGSFRSSGSNITARGNLSTEAFAMLDSIGASVSSVNAYLDVQLGQNRQAAACSLSVSEAVYADIHADSISFNGSFVRDQNGISGLGSLFADTVLMGGLPYSISALFTAEPGSVQIDSIQIIAPGNLDLGLSGTFSYEPEKLGFVLNGIALTRAGKLRLISQGDLEIHTDSSGVQLDTLWLDLPSGEITAEGFLEADSMGLSAALTNVDIASFTSMLGLSVPLSGILEAGVEVSGKMGDLRTEISLLVDHPTYDEWDQSDSLTLSMSSSGDSLIVNGLWSWSDGIRSGLRIGMDGIWSRERSLDIKPPDIMWLEAELTGVGDELFYLLPMPLKTSGASVSARIEYQRETAELSAGIASHFNRLYLTNPGMEFPGVSVYMTYPDQQEDGNYNGSLRLNSGEGQVTTLQSTLLLDVREDLSFARGSLPLELRGYNLQVDFNGWETLIAGVGWLKLSGTLHSGSDDLTERPRVVGKINIDAATISMGGGGAIEGSGRSSSSSPETDLPLDLNIRIEGDRGIWFRNSYANVELSTEIDITTVRNRLSIGGDVSAVRGGVYLLGREFRITQGEVRILQTTPLGVELDIQAAAKVRSSVSGAEYTITVSVTGDPENPEITLSATGPAGVVSEQDIVTLLTAGMTYGELQQFDSTALGSVAGNYLGQWLARSIRDDVGLDALQFTPDFSSDTTSLLVNAGKYVLPDLFVSFSSDVFSSDAGTVSAQYFFNRDFFLEGSTKSTLTGSHDPSLELHYTYRY